MLSTIFKVTTSNPQEKLPVGNPLNNVRVYILDENLKQVAQGETGEV